MRRPTWAPMIPPTKAPTPISTDDEPVDLVAREEHEDGGGDDVDDEGEHVLVAVEALQRLGAQRTEDAHEQHALRGTEVPAVHPGDQVADTHGGSVPARHGLALGRGHPPLDAGAEDDEDERDEDEHGHDRLEGTGRQHEQQARTDDRPDERQRHEASSVAACPVSCDGSPTSR